MKNKELAFEYLRDALMVNPDIGMALPNEKRLEDADKDELSKLLLLIAQTTGAFNLVNSLTPEDLKVRQQKNMETLDKNNEILIRNTENTYDTIMKLKDSLTEVMKNAQRAYSYVLWMYIVAFVLGIALIVMATIFAIEGKTILAAAFGTVGLIDLVTYFVKKPPLEIQNSRSNLAQLIIIQTNWFVDLMNLNAFMAQKMNSLNLDELGAISDKQNENTAKMIALIEKYSERQDS